MTKMSGYYKFFGQFCLMLIAVKDNNSILYGTMTKVANHIGVNSKTISRWIKAGDRIVYKNGFEIFLKVKKLK